MDVVVFGPNLSRNAELKGAFHVHAEGCGDCRHYGNGKKFGGERDGWHISVATEEDAVEAIYGPDEFNYNPMDAVEREPYDQDFYFAPCVSLPNRIFAKEGE